jgi:hypothetical protein
MLTLGAAARLAVVSNSTLARAIKAGRMSAASRRDQDRLSLAQMERLRAELRPNLVFVLEQKPQPRRAAGAKVGSSLCSTGSVDIQVRLYSRSQLERPTAQLACSQAAIRTATPPLVGTTGTADHKH